MQTIDIVHVFANFNVNVVTFVSLRTITKAIFRPRCIQESPS